MAVRKILSQLETEKVQTMTLKLTHRPTPVSAYNVMEDLGSYLVNGTAKTCGYGPKTDELLKKMGVRERNKVLDDLHDVFHWLSESSRSTGKQSS